MTAEKLDSTKREWKIMEKCETYLNTINHVFIGFVSIYMTIFCYNQGNSSRTLHVWFCTIGYQLLMAEAILSLYSGNSWSRLHTTRTRRNIHWILQVIGSAVILAGLIVEYKLHNRHFRGIHELTGLISGILLIISLVNGIAALWSYELRRFIRPVYFKTFHNLLGVSTFVVGMVSLIYGYRLRYMTRAVDAALLEFFVAIAIISVLLSLIGAIRSWWSQLSGTFQR